MIVSMKNDAGLVRQVTIGFCWTAFFFGPLPFFFRGMPQNGFIWCCLPVIGNFVLPFKMNKYTAHYYLEHGYRPIGKGWNTAAPLWGVALPAGEHRESQDNALGRDESSDTQFKFKTWHKVVAGVLVAVAIAGNINKHQAASESVQKAELPATTAINTTASLPAATLAHVEAEQQRNVSAVERATQIDERQEAPSHNKAIYLDTASRVDAIVQKANQSGNLDSGNCSDTISQYRDAVSKIINEYAEAGQPDMGYELATSNIRATWIDSIAHNCGVRE